MTNEQYSSDLPRFYHFISAHRYRALICLHAIEPDFKGARTYLPEQYTE